MSRRPLTRPGRSLIEQDASRSPHPDEPPKASATARHADWPPKRPAPDSTNAASGRRVSVLDGSQAARRRPGCPPALGVRGDSGGRPTAEPPGATSLAPPSADPAHRPRRVSFPKPGTSPDLRSPARRFRQPQPPSCDTRPALHAGWHSAEPLDVAHLSVIAGKRSAARISVAPPMRFGPSRRTSAPGDRCSRRLTSPTPSALRVPTPLDGLIPPGPATLSTWSRPPTGFHRPKNAVIRGGGVRRR